MPNFEAVQDRITGTLGNLKTIAHIHVMSVEKESFDNMVKAFKELQRDDKMLQELLKERMTHEEYEDLMAKFDAARK